MPGRQPGWKRARGLVRERRRKEGKEGGTGRIVQVPTKIFLWHCAGDILGSLSSALRHPDLPKLDHISKHCRLSWAECTLEPVLSRQSTQKNCPTFSFPSSFSRKLCHQQGLGSTQGEIDGAEPEPLCSLCTQPRLARTNEVYQPGHQEPLITQKNNRVK